jgi:hypothetical protein
MVLKKGNPIQRRTPIKRAFNIMVDEFDRTLPLLRSLEEDERRRLLDGYLREMDKLGLRLDSSYIERLKSPRIEYHFELPSLGDVIHGSRTLSKGSGQIHNTAKNRLKPKDHGSQLYCFTVTCHYLTPKERETLRSTREEYSGEKCLARSRLASRLKTN